MLELPETLIVGAIPMNFQIKADPAPLKMDATGTVRVGGTRVTLDTVIGAFALGFSADEIAEQYPAVRLCDIHSTLGYYLRRKDEVDEYLSERDAKAAKLKSEIERKFPTNGIRRRLLKRRAERAKVR